MGWVLASACSGVKPIQKGDTVRCPSCGATFTIEEGMGHAK
jgi:RNA polymerase subunit RPABC4/transcription elongation factor Spt4